MVLGTNVIAHSATLRRHYLLARSSYTEAWASYPIAVYIDANSYRGEDYEVSTAATNYEQGTILGSEFDDSTETVDK